MKLQSWLLILWPAFLLACAAEWIVFALVDPTDFHWRGNALGLSRQAIYTSAFFIFWLIAAGSSSLTLWLAGSEKNLNSPAD